MADVWQENLKEEVDFWRKIINFTHPYKNWCEEFHRRVEGDGTAPARVHPYLEAAHRILDVGSGPVSKLGAYLHGKPLDITAVDPLANEYNALLDEAGIRPVIRTQFATGEELPRYVSGKFDLVYSINALDHSRDPILVIRNMLSLCRGGGIVRIENSINEGLRNKYESLHQWNFMPADGDLVIWNKSGIGRLLSRNIEPDSISSIKIDISQEGWFFMNILKK